MCIQRLKMVVNCGVCGKRECKKRKIVDNICNECSANTQNNTNNDAEEVPIQAMFEEGFLNTSLTTLRLASVITTINKIKNYNTRDHKNGERFESH